MNLNISPRFLLLLYVQLHTYVYIVPTTPRHDNTSDAGGAGHTPNADEDLGMRIQSAYTVPL